MGEENQKLWAIRYGLLGKWSIGRVSGSLQGAAISESPCSCGVHGKRGCSKPWFFILERYNFNHDGSAADMDELIKFPEMSQITRNTRIGRKMVIEEEGTTNLTNLTNGERKK